MIFVSNRSKPHSHSDKPDVRYCGFTRVKTCCAAVPSMFVSYHSDGYGIRGRISMVLTRNFADTEEEHEPSSGHHLETTTGQTEVCMKRNGIRSARYQTKQEDYKAKRKQLS